MPKKSSEILPPEGENEDSSIWWKTFLSWLETENETAYAKLKKGRLDRQSFLYYAFIFGISAVVAGTALALSQNAASNTNVGDVKNNPPRPSSEAKATAPQAATPTSAPSATVTVSKTSAPVQTPSAKVVTPTKAATPTSTPSPTVSPEDIYFGDRDRRVVLMTYDDAGSYDQVGRVLDAYAARGIRTTFFVVGDRMKKMAASVQRLLAEGHTLGCHAWSHDIPLPQLSLEEVNEQFTKFMEAAAEIAPGYQVHYFRAPFGSRSPRIVKLAADWGMRHILWSVASGGMTDETYANVVDKVFPGAIVLSHMMRPFDISQAGQILDKLIEMGYSVESVETGL